MNSFRTAAALVLTAAIVVACATDNQTATQLPSTPPPATPSPAVTPVPTAGVNAQTVRLALDWTPNTDHTGFYVAKAKGWYPAAGINLQILPYATATPETLVAAHQAECGISFQDSMTFAVAAGADIVSVMAILQKTASAIGVLADGPIQRPLDLDGKTYAGFGYPNEVPTLTAVIQADGGTGDFEVATLDTAAYEALYNKKADFTIPFTAWEGVEATERGIKLRYFQFADYGFPEFYQVVLVCDREWLDNDADVARRFLAATVQGFELAASDPDAGAEMLVAQNPGVFDANPDLPRDSQRFLAEGGFLVDTDGKVGRQTLEQWTAYSSFLFEQGLLVDADGEPLTEPPDYASLFTNDFLP